eukprot:3102525-Amphidinium_carterae.2
MQEQNLSLASCATAALVNLSCGKTNTKTVLMSQGLSSFVFESYARMYGVECIDMRMLADMHSTAEVERR